MKLFALRNVFLLLPLLALQLVVGRVSGNLIIVAWIIATS
jgi:hypothetical protein